LFRSLIPHVSSLCHFEPTSSSQIDLELVGQKQENKFQHPNIPLDLMLEFYNKTMKEAVKKLGPSASPKSLDRIANSLGFTTEICKVFDSSLSVFKRSGKHSKSRQGKTLKKL
jgi:hypothetical protein